MLLEGKRASSEPHITFLDESLINKLPVSFGAFWWSCRLPLISVEVSEGYQKGVERVSEGCQELTCRVAARDAGDVHKSREFVGLSP